LDSTFFAFAYLVRIKDIVMGRNYIGANYSSLIRNY